MLFAKSRLKLVYVSVNWRFISLAHGFQELIKEGIKGATFHEKNGKRGKEALKLSYFIFFVKAFEGS